MLFQESNGNEAAPKPGKPWPFLLASYLHNLGHHDTSLVF
jgi:hypothetical protein